MVNLEHKLTVDDLIVEYMMYKVKYGYEPSFLTSEFVNFLYFFESKMDVEDSLYENTKLFERFFERKNEHDWYRIDDFTTMKKCVEPHMEMIYSEEDKDYLIKANYKLSDFDRSVINTYFTDNGMGKYDDCRGETFKIRNIIGQYLLTQAKRKINENIAVEDNELIIGKSIAAEIISQIWHSHIREQIECQLWPKQCTDIHKYLFDIDLAEMIGVKSMKNELIELYSVISKRVAILYHQDRNLRISTHSRAYLARANYELLIQGYENIINTTFGSYKKSLNIDLSTLTFTQSHTMAGVYFEDDDSEVKTTSFKIENSNVKKLIKSLDKNVENH